MESDSDSSANKGSSRRQQRLAEMKLQKQNKKSQKGGDTAELCKLMQDNARIDTPESQESTDVFEHNLCPEMRSARKVDYCPDCGMPFEYCEYADKNMPCFIRIQKALDTAGSLGPEQVTLSSVGNESDLLKSTKPKKGQPKKMEVTIQRHTRSKRKMVTVINGLELFGVKLEACAKLCSKQFACGASVNKGIPGQTPCVEIQGDVETGLVPLLQKQFNIPEDQITVLVPK